MTIENLLQLTQSRIGEKAAMRERFTLILAHFKEKINFRIIKIAGTNGKGSTSAMLSACLNADGKRVGMFTSPHLIKINERFRVNEQEITDKELEQIARHIEEWLSVFLAHHGAYFMPSFFEIMLLVAIEYFHRNKVEIAIIEAGVGGKNDATSLLTNDLALITSIGLDHAQQLGDTLESVAKDKTGIAQRKTTLIVQHEISDAIKAIIKEECSKYKVRFKTSENYVQQYKASLKTTLATVKIKHQKLDFAPNLKGDFQRQNLNLVIESWLFLKKKGIVKNIESLKAISKTQWKARFEIIGATPIWIIDAAHNEPAIRILMQSLNQISKPAERILLLGISKEKDYKNILKLTAEIASEVYLTDDFYKAHPIEILQAEILKYGLLNPENGDLETLIPTLKNRKGKIIVVTGSIFMIGKAREIIENL